MEKKHYSQERFSDFVDRIVKLLTHVRCIDEDGTIIEDDFSGVAFNFEDNGFDIVNDAIVVEYNDSDKEVLADVYGFKVDYGRIYVEILFYAGPGPCTTDWKPLSWGDMDKKGEALEKIMLSIAQNEVIRALECDLKRFLEESKSFSIPFGCLVSLDDGIPLLNGKVAKALIRDSLDWGRTSACHVLCGESSTIEDCPISPDDSNETVSDFLEKIIGLIENRKSNWEVIVPNKEVNMYDVNVWCSISANAGIHYDTLTIKDKDTIIEKGDLDSIHLVFGSLHVPHGFIIHENAGLDPSIEVIEESEYSS